MAVRAVEQEHRVTSRELFFDLVFVFAFTQVAAMLADDPTFAGIGRGVLVLGALWWAWSAYAWLTNIVDPEEAVVGAALLVALIAMFLAALAVPAVFEDEGVLFGAAFLVVCAVHLALSALAGRGDRNLLGSVARLAPWSLLGAALILVAERHGLVVIIALGEAFISIGIGARGIALGLGEVAAAVLAILVATSFWLAYFGFFSIRGERILGELEGEERVTFGRDAYTYGHLPMIVGIVLLRSR